MTKGRIDPGRYYERRRGDSGWLAETTPGEPEVVICRRVVDYAPASIPAGAGCTTCTRCSALIVYDPHGPHQSTPRVCMQCASIQPLPIEP